MFEITVQLYDKSIIMLISWDQLQYHCHSLKEENMTNNSIQKHQPFIQLDQSFPGIMSLFMYDKETAKNLSQMAQTIMRRPRGLTPGERELIASFVSKVNECDFCCLSHTECAKDLMDPKVVHAFIEEEDSEAISMKMRSLMVIAVFVLSLNREDLPDAVKSAKENGATDEEIHDTVLVTALFCMCNRYVDGLGTIFKDGEPEQGGRSLAKYGYKMTIKRFFGEILPMMWSKFWSNI